jgi:hypothetical protein
LFADVRASQLTCTCCSPTFVTNCLTRSLTRRRDVFVQLPVQFGSCEPIRDRGASTHARTVRQEARTADHLETVLDQPGR